MNIVGVGGRTGTAEFAIGGAVNAGLMNLTKVLADRGLQDGVRVCAINPGSIATERLQTRIHTLAVERGIAAEQAASEMAKKLGVARFGKPEEIAAAVAYLPHRHQRRQENPRRRRRPDADALIAQHSAGLTVRSAR